jgi:hypothetical protein
MNTFNMKQWLQENKVGPYSKALLKEDDSSVPDMPANTDDQEMPVDEAKHSDVAIEAAEMLMRDIEDRDDKTYSKQELERVFDTLEDKYGEYYDDSDFEETIDMLKQDGYIMTFKEDLGVGYVMKTKSPDGKIM